MIAKEKLREIVEKSVEDVWYNRRSMNPVADQTELLTEALHQALSMSGVGSSTYTRELLECTVCCQMLQFCELLNLMPDLWSHKCDNAEFELSQIRKKSEHFEKALKTIRDAFYTDGETDKEKIDDLKAIAFNALYEIEQGLF